MLYNLSTLVRGWGNCEQDQLFFTTQHSSEWPWHALQALPDSIATETRIPDFKRQTLCRLNDESLKMCMWQSLEPTGVLQRAIISQMKLYLLICWPYYRGCIYWAIWRVGVPWLITKTLNCGRGRQMTPELEWSHVRKTYLAWPALRMGGAGCQGL